MVCLEFIVLQKLYWSERGADKLAEATISGAGTYRELILVQASISCFRRI